MMAYHGRFELDSESVESLGLYVKKTCWVPVAEQPLRNLMLGPLLVIRSEGRALPSSRAPQYLFGATSMGGTVRCHK
jgi:hypothetical protein